MEPVDDREESRAITTGDDDMVRTERRNADAGETDETGRNGRRPRCEVDGFALPTCRSRLYFSRSIV